MIEKKELHQVAEILENYGIVSETDVSFLDPDDLRNLTSLGFKSLEAKKLDRWCDSVSASVENMLNVTHDSSLSSVNLICQKCPSPCHPFFPPMT